ncbi:MAG: ATP-binding protein [Oscillospiraceae bacterium]|nr:ATP-binding protein [Oscillospiraceae bacterium]
MALLTEADVRRMSNHGTRGPVVVNRDQKLTPGAMDYLRDHRIEVVYPQGRPEESGPQEEGTVSPGKYQTLFGAVLQDKPEHMTHLKGNILVFKDHPRIAFRGWIDALEAEITLTQQAAAGEGFHTLAEELEEVLGFVRRYIRFDVLDEPVGTFTLCGYTPDQLRTYSHYPERHLGHPHFLVHYTDGPSLLAVNRLRTLVRQVELAAYAAFRDPDGNVTRPDMILGLNRLSSLMWIMMIKLKAGSYARTTAESQSVFPHGGTVRQGGA